MLLIPRDLFESIVPERPRDFSIVLSDYRTKCATETLDIKRLLNAIEQAKHPLVIVGGGMRYTSSNSSLKKMVDYFDLKVATTLADVNAFPHDDPHYLGMIGIAGHPSVHHYLKTHVDLVIAIGEEFSTLVKTPIEPTLSNIKTLYIGTDATKAAGALTPATSCKFGDSSVVPVKAGSHSQDSTGVTSGMDSRLHGKDNVFTGRDTTHLMFECDIETLLAHTMLIVANNGYTDRLNDKQKSQPIQKNYYKPGITQSSDKKKSKGLLTSQALTILQPFLTCPENVIFDAGNCVVSALHYLHFPSEVKTIISLGMGGMGYAIAAGIGAQLGGPKQKSTWVITGDGGFLISGLEIHTAVEYQLPILFIIFNNNRHGMCVTRQQQYFSHRVTASTYGTLDVAKTVRGLGNKNRLWVACAKTPIDLQIQLTEYCQKFSDKPGVLEIKINIDEVPPFIPFLMEKEGAQ